MMIILVSMITLVGIIIGGALLAEGTLYLVEKVFNVVRCPSCGFLYHKVDGAPMCPECTHKLLEELDEWDADCLADRQEEVLGTAYEGMMPKNDEVSTADFIDKTGYYPCYIEWSEVEDTHTEYVCRQEPLTAALQCAEYLRNEEGETLPTKMWEVVWDHGTHQIGAE